MQRELSSNIQSIYLKEIQKIPLLTKEEEIKLGKRLQKGDRKAIEILVFHNLRLSAFIARSYLKNSILYNGMNAREFLDICEVANIGLIKAASKFDETKNCRFSTIAVPYIHNQIKMSLSKEGLFKVTGAIFKKYYCIEKIKENQKRLSEIDPSLKELEEETKIPISKIQEIENIYFPKEYEDNLVDENKIEKYPSFILEDFEEKIVDTLDAKEEVSSYLSFLKERDRQIVELLYGVNGKPLLQVSEIAQIFHITKSRVHQIKEESFEIIRNSYEDILRKKEEVKRWKYILAHLEEYNLKNKKVKQKKKV